MKNHKIIEVMEPMTLLRQRPKTRQNPKDKSDLLKTIASKASKNWQHQVRNEDFAKAKGSEGWLNRVKICFVQKRKSLFPKRL